MENIRDRFKDAPWMERCISENILVVGCGGIGSNALYNLTKTIPCNYYIQDIDTCDTINVGSQFFSLNDVGKSKVQALQATLKSYSGITPSLLTSKFIESSPVLPITISALDNMQARKDVFNAWNKRSNKEVLIDGRLRADYYEIYMVTPGREEEYADTLFSDSEVSSGPCTFKATAYFGMLIGARITHLMVNYLTNKYAESEIMSVPFKIEEFGSLFHYEIHN